MSDRTTRALTEERDQLRAENRALTEARGELLETVERLEREVARLNRERLYRGFA